MSTTQEPQTEGQTEERQEYAWVKQTPETRIDGTITGTIYAGELSGRVEQNDMRFGFIIENPTVVEGTIYRNEAKDDSLARDEFEDGSPTDYRVVDPSDNRSTNFVEVGGEKFLTSKENVGNSYAEADDFDEDTVILWQNGMAGQYIARALDFNGLPFADQKEDTGYIVKGLFQVADGWRERANRSRLAKDGKAPRVARIPVLRPDAEGQRVAFYIGRYNGGRMYEGRVHLVDDESTELTDDNEFDLRYADDAEDVVAEHDITMFMYGGDGWSYDGAVQEAETEHEFDFDEGGNDEDHLTSKQRAFVTQVSDLLEGTGMTPEERFGKSIAELAESKGVEGAVDVEEEVYAEVSHLDYEDLQ